MNCCLLILGSRNQLLLLRKMSNPGYDIILNFQAEIVSHCTKMTERRIFMEKIYSRQQADYIIATLVNLRRTGT
jgi:hypothetical protein